MPRTRLGRALLRTTPVSPNPSSPSPPTNPASPAPAPNTITTTTHATAHTSVSKKPRVSVHNKAKKDSATSNRVVSRKKGAPRGLAVAQARGNVQTLAAPAPVSVASAGGLSAGIRAQMLPLLPEWTACLFLRSQAGLATSPEQKQGVYALLWSLLQPVIATASESDHNGPLFIEGAHALVRAVMVLESTEEAAAGQGAVAALEQGALKKDASIEGSVNAATLGDGDGGACAGYGGAGNGSRDGISGRSGRGITVSTDAMGSTAPRSELTSLSATPTSDVALVAPASAPSAAPFAMVETGAGGSTADTPLAETRGETVATSKAAAAVMTTLRVATAGAMHRARLCGAMGLMAQESREYGASYGGSTLVCLHKTVQGVESGLESGVSSGLTQGVSINVLRESRNGSASIAVNASAIAGGKDSNNDTVQGARHYPEAQDANHMAPAVRDGSKRSGVSGGVESAESILSSSASLTLATEAVVTTPEPSNGALQAATDSATASTAAAEAFAGVHVTTTSDSRNETNGTGATTTPYLLSCLQAPIPVVTPATWQELYTRLGFALSHDSTNFRVTALMAIMAAIMKLEESRFYGERALFLATRSDLSREGWLAVLQAAKQKKGGRSDILTNSWFLGQVEAFYRDYSGRELLVRTGSVSSSSVAPATANASASAVPADANSSSARLSKVRAKPTRSKAGASGHRKASTPASSAEAAASAAHTRAAPAPQRGTATATTTALAPETASAPATVPLLSVQDAQAQALLVADARGRQLLARLQAALWPQLRLEQWAEALAQESTWLLQVVRTLVVGQQQPEQGQEQGHSTIRVTSLESRESVGSAACTEGRGSAADTTLLSVGAPQLEAVALKASAEVSNTNEADACVSTERDSASAGNDLLDAAATEVSAVLQAVDTAAACAVADAADYADDAVHAAAASAAHYLLSDAVYNALEQSQILLLPLRSYSYTYPDIPPVPLKIMAVWEGESTDSTETNAAGANTAIGSAITKEAAPTVGNSPVPKGSIPQGAAVTASLKVGAGAGAKAALAGAMRQDNREQAATLHQSTGGTSVPAYAAYPEHTAHKLAATAGSNGVVSVTETVSPAPFWHAAETYPAAEASAAVSASASAATHASAVALSQGESYTNEHVESGLLAQSSPRLLQWWQDKGQKKQRLSSYESLVRWGPQFNLVVYAPKLEEALIQGRAHEANLAARARQALRSYLCQIVGPAFVRYGLASLQLVHDSSELMSLRLYQVQVYAAQNAASGAGAGTKTETVGSHYGESTLADLCVASGMSLRSFARLELLQLTQPMLLEMTQLPAFLHAHSLDTAFSLERVLGRTYIYRYRQLGYKRPLSAYAQKYPLRTDVFLGCTQARELIQEYYAVRLFKTRGPRLYTPIYSALQQEGVTAVFVYVAPLSNATGTATHDSAVLKDSAASAAETAAAVSAAGRSTVITGQAQTESSAHGAHVAPSAALTTSSPAFVASTAVTANSTVAPAITEDTVATQESKAYPELAVLRGTDENNVASGAVGVTDAASAVSTDCAPATAAGREGSAIVSEASLLRSNATISGASTTTNNNKKNTNNSTSVLGSDAALAAQRQHLGALTASASSTKQSTSASAHRGMAASLVSPLCAASAYGGSDADKAQQPQGAGADKAPRDDGAAASASGKGSSLSYQQSSHGTTTAALTAPAPEMPAPDVALSLELLTQVERAIALALQEQVAGLEGASVLSMTALAQVTGYACGSKYLYLDFMVGSLPLFVRALARAQALLEMWQVPVGRLCYHSFRRED